MRSRLIEVLSGWIPAYLVPEPSLVWSLAFLLTLILAIRFADRAGLDARVMFMAAAAGIAGAMVGGRLWAIAVTGDSGFDLLSGEKQVLGAGLGGVAAAGLVLMLARRSVLAYADAAMPAALLGYAFARIGCFLNGCCAGTPSDVPWAMRLPRGTEGFDGQVSAGLISPDAALALPAHPAALYAAATAVLLYLVVRRVDGPPGWRAAAAVFGYGATRFLLEFCRADATPTGYGLSVGQAGCLGLMLIAAVVAFAAWRTMRRPAVACTGGAV